MHIKECMFPQQPILHNLKGTISKALSSMGRLLPIDDAIALLKIISSVAQRYKISSSPPSKKAKSEVHRRFVEG